MNPARRRPFGPTTLAALVVANMVGAGVFTTSGFALADLGSAGRVLAAWVVGGGIAICGAIGYGALARQLTESGGEYLFLSRVLHPAAGFVAGWISLLAGFTGAIAFAAHAFESYVHPLAPGLPTNLLAVGTIVLGVIPLLQDVFWVGMAVTIMGGLAFGSILTMILVPVLYAIFYRAHPARAPDVQLG